MLWKDNGITYMERGNKILLDPHRIARDGTVFISHAHSDHAKSHRTDMVMSRETSELTGIDAKHASIGRPMDLGWEKVSFHNAGHVLGSVQMKLENSGIVYTSDFKLQDSILFPGAEIVPSETLVIESTFGTKDFSFPEREKVYSEIAGWVKANYDVGRVVLLGGYAIGKSQELVKVINDYCGIPVLVHPKIGSINRIYESNGVALGEWAEFGSEEAKEIQKDNFVAIVPMHLLKNKFIDAVRVQTKRRVVAGAATGWAGIFNFHGSGIEKCFQLSDHADFHQLLEYVEQSAPKKAFTVHGYANEFARQLRRMGVKAEPLKGRKSQRTLGQW